MLLRIWVYAAALAVGFGMSVAAQEVTAPKDQPRQQEGTSAGLNERQSQQSRTADVPTALQSIEAAIRNLERQVNEVDEQRTREQAERNTVAQEAVAHWSELMFYAATASLFLTFFALLAIIRTLHHTRRAADSSVELAEEARVTTKAALETVAVTREIGARQLRPYLAFHSGTVKQLGVQGSKERFLELDICFRNCGVSPAVITATTSVIYAPSGGPRWELKTQSWRPTRIFIGPSQTEQVRYQAISADKNGRFSWFTMGILLQYSVGSGEPNDTPFEDYIWLTYDGSGLRQDYHDPSFSIYRPSDVDGLVGD